MRKIVALLALMAPVVLAPAVMATAAHADDSEGYATVGVQHGDIGKLGKGFNEVGVGVGFNFDKYFAVEGDVATGVGAVNSTLFGLHSRAKLQNQLAGYLVGTYPVSKDLDIVVKGGMLLNKIRNSSGAASTNTQASGPSLDVGVHYYPNSGVNGVALDLSHTDLGHNGQETVAQLAYVRRF